ncbi:hypothetical protein DH2020_038356 [Rehmannia glutinosa]|uniref:Uncharacterized protein n=1 Tax=Rehmannia glutinosa TaxID=99300 RepID=A0ABR0V080_REHGL
MVGYIMRSLLLILVFALVDSQARTLTENYDKLKANYGKHSNPPPPAPTTAPPTREVFPLLESWNNYIRPGKPSPPPPQPSVIQIISTRSRANNNFWTLKNYGKIPRPPPPAPKLPPPIHQVTGVGLAALAKSPPDLFLSSA